MSDWGPSESASSGRGCTACCAAATGTTYVTFGKVSEGHDACKPLGVRWIEPVLVGTNPVIVHPNALGEAQMAAQALKALRRL